MFYVLFETSLNLTMRKRSKSRLESQADTQGSTLSTNNSFYLSDSMVNSQMLDDEGTLVEIVEVASDLLLDRFVEFTSRAVLVRIYVGPKNPGAMLACTFASTKPELIHYVDTGFFQIIEHDVPVLLCSPTSSCSAERFQTLIENSLDQKVRSVSQMMNHVNLTFSVAQAVWYFVASRERSVVSDSSEVALKTAVDDSRAQVRNAVLMHSTNPSFYVDEFCLLCGQGAPLATLHASLERIELHLRRSVFDQPATAQPLALSIICLFDVLSHTTDSKPSVREGIASIIVQMTTMLQREDLHLVFRPHANQFIQAFVPFVTSSFSKGWSEVMNMMVASLLGLVPPVLMGSRVSCMPFPLNFQLTQQLTAGCRFSVDTLFPTPETNFFSQEAVRKLLDPQVTDDLTREQLRGETRKVFADGVAVMWSSFRSLFECFSCVENSIGEAVAEKKASADMLSPQSHLEMMRSLSHCLLSLLRSLWTLPPKISAKILMFVVPSVNSFFRRIVCWCDVLIIAPLWETVFSAAVAYVIALSLAKPEALKLSVVNHEWLAKISTATGALCHRAALFECHYFLVTMSMVFPTWEENQRDGRAIKSALESVVSAANDVAIAAPSPSQLLVVWEDVREVVAVFLQLAEDPSYGPTRRKVAKLLFESQSELVDINHVPEEIPVVRADWSDYHSWNLMQQDHTATSEGVAESDWLRLQPALWYVCSFIREEKTKKRFTSLGTELLAVADVLMQASCNQALCSMFVESGVRFLLDHGSATGETVDISASAYNSILFQWISVCPAFRLTEKVVAHENHAAALSRHQVMRQHEGVDRHQKSVIIADPSFFPAENSAAELSNGSGAANVSRRVKTALLDQISAVYSS